MDKKAPWHIDWSDELSVGIAEIDAEHQHFIGLINDFNRVVSDRPEIIQLTALLEDILQDAKLHFAHEEQMFAEYDYNGHEQHAAIHNAILQTLDKRVAMLNNSSKDADWIQLGLDMKHILVRHLLEEDMKYVNKINAIAAN